MRFFSTRSPDGETVSFAEACLRGLAPDGGLYVPQNLPRVDAALEGWRTLSYADLMTRIIKLYAGSDLTDACIDQLVSKANARFRLREMTQLANLPTPDFTILELFHGPTYSFKDYALSFVGLLIDELLKRQNRNALALVATSGDTGSAAIAGFKGCTRVKCCVLMPHERVSMIQRKQMTTQCDDRTKVLSVKGTFDDCQRLLKRFLREKRLQERFNLIAVNSVNFARISCQIVYYFWAAFRFQESREDEKTPISFCVPTGNFGNILAAYYAKCMGCPIAKLIIASNSNDILTRCWRSGTYTLTDVIPTVSPAIDIQVSSNFERLLSHISSVSTRTIFDQLSTDGSFSLDKNTRKKMEEAFLAYCASETDTLEACKAMYQEYQYLIDTHTGVGYHAVRQARKEGLEGPIVLVATAHPSKFAEHLYHVLPQSVVDSVMPDEFKRLVVSKEVCEITALEDVEMIIEKLFGQNE